MENEMKMNATLDFSQIISDGNDLISVENPYAVQQSEIKEMKAAIANKTVCFGTIFGVEVGSDDSTRMALKKGTLRVIIPAEDFFRYSQFKDMDESDAAERNVRYRRKGSHMLGGSIGFIPKAIGEDENGIPFVVASRREAMERMQDKCFYGPRAKVAIGTVAKASVVSSGPNYITVECMGYETVIGTGALSAHEFIDNAEEKYKPGDGILVAVQELEVDKENRRLTRFVLSHAMVENQMTKVERVSEKLIRSRYSAHVTGVSEGYYKVIIDGLKIGGLVPFQYYLGEGTLEKGNEVSFFVTGIDEKRNMCIGKCMKTRTCD